MGRAPCCDKTKVKRGPWSPEEDVTLKNYVEKYGTGGNWIALPHKAGLRRCGKSCRLRWLNYLRPDIKHGGFTEEEDNIIVTLYRNIGSRWSVIASQLPGRTDNDVKNYWNTKLKKKLLSLNSTLQSTVAADNPMDFGMQAPPSQLQPPPPPLTKHKTNCYGNSQITSLVSCSDHTLMPYHEMGTINNNNTSSRSNGTQECIVSEYMFHRDVDESSDIIDNNNNNNILPLPTLMEVQENGTTYNNNCCFMTTTSSSQEISTPSSPPSYCLGTTSTNYAAATSSSSNWSDNTVVVGEEVLGFLVEFGSKLPHSSSSSLSSNNNFALLNVNGFDYQEKFIIGTDDEDHQEIHIPTNSTASNLVNYSYSSTGTTLLANISENGTAAGLRHHQN